ncbi:Methyltransferase FkbM domain-containing protein [Nitrosospira sp. Nsp18]|uniref:FkbM family methyltransferase n=1 Tax=Nitrosospira sp. Nsp18 TaxID=1855334 RepID=UPI0008914AE9|nr:FkbM family methyltransferase [Nitrosospira sp. Nsp18]SDA27876.1 Methyltransferase FkbM domain-containing protein [Nitrosospira sp. Nsp18]
MLTKLKKIAHDLTISLEDLTITADRNYQLSIHAEIDRLRGSVRYKIPKSLIPFGGKIYSQNDEDGIIREIFIRIGTTNRIFVEFGIGNGLENNTLALLFDDWQGLWIDASSGSIANIRTHFAEIIQQGKLAVIESFITKANINDLISANVKHSEIDLLSIDIDGNDYHVLNAISCIKPRVIVIEYNAKFAPPVLYCMDYAETHIWKGDDCFGVSLKFLEINLDKMGYCLVGCNLSGANAFFVRKELVVDKFLEPFTAENHFEPARYYLSGYASGHRPTYQTLAKSLTMRPT